MRDPRLQRERGGDKGRQEDYYLWREERRYKGKVQNRNTDLTLLTPLMSILRGKVSAENNPRAGCSLEELQL